MKNNFARKCYNFPHRLKTSAQPRRKGFPANVYLFKVNNRNTRKGYKICSELILKMASFWCFCF